VSSDLFEATEVEALKAEIARLKFLNREEQQTIEELSRLLLKAAEALDWGHCPTGPREGCPVCALIAQLRHAAQ